MSVCSLCGKDKDLNLSGLCAACENAKRISQMFSIDPEIKMQRAKEKERREKENKEKIIEIIKINELMERINNGERIFLHETVFFITDSSTNVRSLDISKGLGAIIDVMKGNINTNLVTTEYFDMSQIMKMGIQGWHIVSAIPKTVSLDITAKLQEILIKLGTTLMGDSSMVFNGYYVIFEKEISKSYPVSSDFLIDYFKRNMNSFFSDDEVRELNKLF